MSKAKVIVNGRLATIESGGKKLSVYNNTGRNPNADKQFIVSEGANVVHVGNMSSAKQAVIDFFRGKLGAG
jgi:hypothetical protein